MLTFTVKLTSNDNCITIVDASEEGFQNMNSFEQLALV